MKLKSTLVLLVLVVVVGGLVLFRPGPPEAVGPPETALFRFTPEQITAVKAVYGTSSFAASRNESGDWTIEQPSKWPARTVAMRPVLKAVADLHHRFAPIPARDPDFDWAKYGLKSPKATITVTAGDKTHTVVVGSVHGARFNRKAYVRVNDEPKVLEVAAAIYDRFTQGVDRLRERSLFSSEEYKENKWDDGKKRRVKADEITVSGKDGSFSLKREGETWRVTAPLQDRPDPDKLKKLLAAIPMLWAEDFIDDAPKELKQYGLDKPERQVTVVAGKRKVVLQIGKFHQTKTYTIKKPKPPQRGRPPMGPQETVEEVKEDFHYARLAHYPCVFEVKAVKFDELFIKPEDIRDKKVVRFDTYDAKHVELAYGDLHIELKKKDWDWHMVKPAETKAEHNTVSTLLDKTTGLEGKEFVYSDDLKKYGLDKPAGKLVVTTEKEEEQEGTEEKKKVKATYTVLVGRRLPKSKVVYVKQADDKRIAAVDPEYLDVLEKGQLDYRSKQVLTFTKDDVLTLEVKTSTDHFVVRKDGDKYAFLQPGTGAADKDKVNPILDELDSLSAEEFIADKASDADLEKYGLKAKPYVRAVVTLKPEEKKEEDKDKKKDEKEAKKDEKKAKKKQRVYVLLVGKPTESDKEKRYARMEKERVVFTLGKTPVEKLETGTLDILPKKLWEFARADVQYIDVARGQKRLRLERNGDVWRLAQPVRIDAGTSEVDKLLDKVVDLACDRYIELRAGDLNQYGLAKPHTTLTIGVQDGASGKKDEEKDKGKDKEKKKEEKKPGFKTYVLKIGSPESKGKKSRYAMRSGAGASEAVCVLDESLIDRLAEGHLAYLDRQLIKAEKDEIARFQSTRAGLTFDLAKKDGTWGVASPVQIKPEESALDDLLFFLTDVKAERFEALGKVSLAKYGLDKPYLTATVTTEKTVELPAATQPAATQPAADKKAKGEKGEGTQAAAAPASQPAATKPTKKVVRKTITVAVGKPCASDPKQRYAMVRGQKGVVVLGADTLEKLAWTHLDLLDKKIVEIPTDKVVRFETARAGMALKVEKSDDTWQITSPVKAKGDSETVDSLLSAVNPLRAERFAAYQTKDFKRYGLDKPYVTVRFVLKKDGDDDKKKGAKTETKVILVGSEAAKGKPERYARVQGQGNVFVLAKDVVEKLTGTALYFRDRQVLDLVKSDVDRVLVARAKSRTPAAFGKKGDDWKLLAPVNADAESSDLDALVGDLVSLKAKKYVAERVKDLKTYGLAPKPFATVTLQMKPAEATGKPAKSRPAPKRHVLLVGSPAGKDTKDRYATLQGSGLVFVLSEFTVESLTKEYRKRDVLGSLDASNIKELVLTRGKTTFHLKKSGDLWNLEGDSGASVDKAKVQETLDVLAGLKTTGFVRDTSDELALFGLKGPDLAIVAKTDSDEKTLHLGRTMGPDHKQRYALVPDKDTPGVFLVGEEDQKKLFRNKGDFLTK